MLNVFLDLLPKNSTELNFAWKLARKLVEALQKLYHVDRKIHTDKSADAGIFLIEISLSSLKVCKPILRSHLKQKIAYQ